MAVGGVIQIIVKDTPVLLHEKESTKKYPKRLDIFFGSAGTLKTNRELEEDRKGSSHITRAEHLSSLEAFV